MARIAKPWWWKQHQQWCVVFRGERLLLGSGSLAEATARWHVIAASPIQVHTTISDKGISFTDAYRLYIAALATWATVGAVKTCALTLKPLLGSLEAELPLSLWKPKHFLEAIATRPLWSWQTKVLSRQWFASMWQWAINEQLIEATLTNPIRNVRVGKKPPRMQRRLITAEEVGLWEGLLPDHLADLIRTLYDTGCRPAELIRVTAADFLRASQCWQLWEHKTAKTGRPRIVHLTSRVVAICDAAAKQHATGPLFRSLRGHVWQYSYVVSAKLRHAFAAAKLSSPPKLYDFRHTFVTDMLAKGESASFVAALIGHSGTAILEKHYSHLTQRSDALRASLLRRNAVSA